MKKLVFIVTMIALCITVWAQAQPRKDELAKKENQSVNIQKADNTKKGNTRDCNPITTFPWSESFENLDGNMPECWTQEFLTDNEMTWRNLEGAPDNVWPMAAQSGSYRAVMITLPNQEAKTKLITPRLDLSELTNPRLRFWHAHYWDYLRVYYRTSSNGDWILLDEYITGGTFNYTQRTFLLPNPSDDYYIAFEGETRGTTGRGLNIDNVEVDDFVGYVDAELVNIIAPVAGIYQNLNDPVPITLSIRNNGSEALSNFNIKVEVNGVEVIDETFSGEPIPALSQAEERTITGTLDLSAEGAHVITITLVTAEEDQVPTNNTRSVTVTNNVCTPVTTFPYTENFDDGTTFPPRCWSITHVDGTRWGRNTNPNYSPPAAAIGRNQTTNTISLLVTPQIAIPSTGTFLLEFMSQFIQEVNYDGINRFAEVMI